MIDHVPFEIVLVLSVFLEMGGREYSTVLTIRGDED